MQNSWGKHAGDAGYWKIKRGSNEAGAWDMERGREERITEGDIASEREREGEKKKNRGRDRDGEEQIQRTLGGSMRGMKGTGRSRVAPTKRVR